MNKKIKELIDLLISEDKDIANYLIDLAESVHLNCIYSPGNYLVVNPGKRIVLTAHLDTVSSPFYPTYQDIVYKGNTISLNKKGRKKGLVLGGDDRCGIWIISQMLQDKKFSNKFTYLIFFGEEIGCLGSQNFVDTIGESILKDTWSIVGLDRKGSREVAIYSQATNQALVDIFKPFGFRREYGTISDCAILSRASGIACVNLSVGFVNAHTEQEYIDLSGLLHTYWALRKKKLLEKLESSPFQVEEDTYEFNFKPKKGYEYCDYCFKAFKKRDLYQLDTGIYVCHKCLTDYVYIGEDSHAKNNEK